MSATGHGGVTLIAGSDHATLSPIAVATGEQIVFAHNVGRRAFSVLITSGDPGNYGQVLTSADGFSVAQPNVNTVMVMHDSGDTASLVFVSCRWEEPTPELDLVTAQDSRVQVEEIPR